MEKPNARDTIRGPTRQVDPLDPGWMVAVRDRGCDMPCFEAGSRAADPSPPGMRDRGPA